MILFPEEPIWGLTTVPGLSDADDYSGKTHQWIFEFINSFMTQNAI